MRIQANDQRKLLKAALGEIEADLLIKNIKLVNVLTMEVYPADVYVYDGMIVHVDDLDKKQPGSAKAILDGEGKYLIPGLIDSHMHIESSMMTPRNFAKAVLPCGTTTVIMDPHEIANVCGVEGVKYMHDSGDQLPMRQFVDIPSCVPAVPEVEQAGAAFFAKEVESLASMERVIGLAEVMDFIGVIQGDDRMMEILNVAKEKGLYLQGHAPFVSGRMLSAYLCGGPNTCHETREGSEGLEKMRKGMFVDARDSSISKNVKDILEGCKHLTCYDMLCFCTDDREADEILTSGHMNDVVNHAIACGMDPIVAIRCATWNVAREIRMENIGAIAPGFVADMLLVESLEHIQPTHVICKGKVVAKDGKLVEEIVKQTFAIETLNTMHVKPLCQEDFKIKVEKDVKEVDVNIMVYKDLLLSTTTSTTITLPVKDGCIDISHDKSLKFVAIINRHKNNDNIALGIVKGFGTEKGTIASTVSHDCHNLTIVYDTCENALLAANALISCGGGMCAVEDGEILHTLELPLAGLMSLKEAEELAIDNAKMKDANRKLGLVALDNPLLRIVTLALPVIPDVKMSDQGLVNVLTKEIIPLFASFKS